jgi:hypothetical protein
MGLLKSLSHVPRRGVAPQDVEKDFQHPARPSPRHAYRTSLGQRGDKGQRCTIPCSVVLVREWREREPQREQRCSRNVCHAEAHQEYGRGSTRAPACAKPNNALSDGSSSLAGAGKSSWFSQRQECTLPHWEVGVEPSGRSEREQERGGIAGWGGETAPPVGFANLRGFRGACVVRGPRFSKSAGRFWYGSYH